MGFSQWQQGVVDTEASFSASFASWVLIEEHNYHVNKLWSAFIIKVTVGTLHDYNCWPDTKKSVQLDIKKGFLFQEEGDVLKDDTLEICDAS